jgi:hypothetical protein
MDRSVAIDNILYTVENIRQHCRHLATPASEGAGVGHNGGRGAQ